MRALRRGLLPRSVFFVGGALSAVLAVAALVCSGRPVGDCFGLWPRNDRRADKPIQMVKRWPKLPLSFEPNVGQAPGGVQFVVHVGAGVALLSHDGVTLSVPAAEEKTKKLVSTPKRAIGPASLVRTELVGAANVKGEALEELPGKANYFLGNDAASWHAGVRTYSRVQFRDVWPGVDVVYHGENGELEYDFVVHPGAASERIRLAFEGAQVVKGEGGNLHLEGSGWTFTLRRPATYQETEHGRRYVDSGFAVPSTSAQARKGHQVAFWVADHDRSRPLVIDPVVLSYSTYLGGNTDDQGNGIAVDASGSVYLIGSTRSTNFPVAGALQNKFGGGNWDAFVSKLNAAGSALVYSTYLGGSGDDLGNAIAVDSSGSAYVTGETTSTNFPTATPLQAANAGSNDAFVAKLNASGSMLVYSTYLGGSGTDDATGIAVDGQKNVYVTGSTSSTDFPTANPLQMTSGGEYDAFVASLNPAGSALVYSTYLGGSAYDEASSIAVDASGNAYIAGYTTSPDFPTASPLQASLDGPQDAFIAKLGTSGAPLSYSTYLGGSGFDQANSIGIDSIGNAYVTGYTTSTDFPTASPIQSTYGGNGDAFVTKVNPSGSALVYSTYLGGTQVDTGNGITVDSLGSAYVTGSTNSTNFPLATPLQATNGGDAGSYDVFMTRLNGSGSALLYSTYLGGTGNDNGFAIAVDSSGSAHVTGDTNSLNFPTASPLQGSLGSAGATNAFVLSVCCDGGPSDAGVKDAGADGSAVLSDAGTLGSGDAATASTDGGLADSGDAGTARPDAGAPDASPAGIDSGVPVSTDAGSGSVDGGSSSSGGGCGCGETGPVPLGFIVAFACALRTRRRINELTAK
jgi:hypothetical protein